MDSKDKQQPSLMYPAPLAAERGASVSQDRKDVDMETPILIIGGGPVGMLQALILSRIHNQECMVIEREKNTTTYPKMEYTNGRSMEIYRKMGLHEEFRTRASTYLPETAPADEMNITSFGPGGHLIHNWKRPNAAEHRLDSKDHNDGSKYLEPHLRAHQILVEKWLKEWIQQEEKVKATWGLSFIALVEEKDHVISEVKRDDGTTIRIKSDYVIGCDGAGSWVRKSAGLESKRDLLNIRSAFVHMKSKKFREMLPYGGFWHTNVITGGIIVAQDEVETFTVHLMLPPDVDSLPLSVQDIVNTACSGTLNNVDIPIDEVLCRGLWKGHVSVANKFRSDGGRVFLAGDAAHQLSPVGGHGLNSGLADAYDLAWKLIANIQGWGGEDLLESYDRERRQIAFKNLASTEEALEKIVLPLIVNPGIDRNTIDADTTEAEIERQKLGEKFAEQHWFHDQNGNILGYQYVDSPVILTEQENAERPVSKNFVYNPTTFPGSRAPHVWLADGKTSTLDLFVGDKFNLVDFSASSLLSKPFVQAAKETGVPLNVIILDAAKEKVTRKVYERDLILIRPDGHVAWRNDSSASHPETIEKAKEILRTVAGLKSTIV